MRPIISLRPTPTPEQAIAQVLAQIRAGLKPGEWVERVELPLEGVYLVDHEKIVPETGPAAIPEGPV